MSYNRAYTHCACLQTVVSSHLVMSHIKIPPPLCRYAGKKLHTSLLFDEFSKPSNAFNQFIEECLHQSKLCHPNIVRLIGVNFPDPIFPVPTIIMEYLPMTLTQCLNKYPQLPTHLENSLLLDVASGVEYLHGQSPPIMHRDLTSNNVLLTNHLQAKISDLGQAKIFDFSVTTTLTTAPGNVRYMPPEAKAHKSVYSTKIDVFSFGVLILNVLTHEWPSGDPVLDPKTHLEIPVTEVEKRKACFDKMDKESPLYSLAVECLDNDPKKRPDATALVEKIGKYSQTVPFKNMLEMHLALESELSKTMILEKHIQEVDIKVQAIADAFNWSLIDETGSDTTVSAPPNASMLTEAYTQLQQISSTNKSVLANMGSPQLIVGYKSPANSGKNNLLLSVQKPSGAGMNIIVRTPLSIHFTGTHLRSIEGIKEPWGLAAGRQGQVFVADSGGNKGVLLYSRTGELLGSYVQSLSRVGFKTTEGQCYYPRNIAISGKDEFIIADTWCHRIQRFKLSPDLKEAQFDKCVGREGKGNLEFNLPMGIRVNKTNGNVYVCDKENHRIQVLDQQLQFKASFGKEGDDPCEFRHPWDIDFDSKGNIYVADCGHYVIKVFTHNWEYQGVIGGEGHGKGRFQHIASICIDEHDYIYATDKTWNCVQVFNPRREFVMQVQLLVKSSEPRGVAVDNDGFVYVSCKATGCVHVYK